MENKKYCLKLDTEHEKVLNSEEKQQEMIEWLRGQLRRSRGVTTKKTDVAKIARATAKAWDSSADVTERLQAMYDFMANGKDANGNELTWDDLWGEAKSIAGDMLEENVVKNDEQAVNCLADELINSFYDFNDEAKEETEIEYKKTRSRKERQLRADYDARLAKAHEKNRQIIEDSIKKYGTVKSDNEYFRSEEVYQKEEMHNAKAKVVSVITVIALFFATVFTMKDNLLLSSVSFILYQSFGYFGLFGLTINKNDILGTAPIWREDWFIFETRIALGFFVVLTFIYFFAGRWYSVAVFAVLSIFKFYRKAFMDISIFIFSLFPCIFRH